jgi:hypothetical protein
VRQRLGSPFVPSGCAGWPRIKGNSSPECETGAERPLPMDNSLAWTIPGKDPLPGPVFIPVACGPAKLGFHARRPWISLTDENLVVAACVPWWWAVHGRRRVHRRSILFGGLRLDVRTPLRIIKSWPLTLDRAEDIRSRVCETWT